MKCTVIGGSGQLGAVLVKQLVEAHHEVRSFDIRKPTVCVEGCEYVEGDICDYESVKKAVKGSEAVFHTVSIIDLSPFPKPITRKVNVGGTQNVVSSCQEMNVKYLVYTSSMDVVFNGDNIRNGDENSLSYASQPLNGYIATKIEGEKLVLKANCPSLLTCALRLAHIYSENDRMISDVLDLVQLGKVPFRFGEGELSYIHVDNVAHAHVCALRALSSSSHSIAGKPFFISEHTSSFWNFMTPFLESRGLELPRGGGRALFLAVYFLACLVDFGCWLLSCVGIVGIGGSSDYGFDGVPETPITRYVVLAVERDYYFNTKRAREEMGFELLFGREEGIKRTLDGLARKEREEGKGRKGLKAKGGDVVGKGIRMSTFLYGIVMAYLGALLFFFPAFMSSWIFSPSPSPSVFTVLSFSAENMTLSNSGDLQKSDVLCQTGGLIYIVLGAYSLVASLSPFSPSYFLLSYPPRIISSLFYLYHIATHELPSYPFLSLILFEMILSLHTAISISSSISPPSFSSLTSRYDLLSLSQSLHSILSGLFALLMSLSPLLVLPLVFPQADIAGCGEGCEGAAGWEDEKCKVIGFAHVMGNAEFFMTWVYTMSAFCVEMEEFAWLSVYTRFGACLLLLFGFVTSISTLDQLCGVIPDVLLASFTLYLLLKKKKTE